MFTRAMLKIVIAMLHHNTGIRLRSGLGLLEGLGLRFLKALRFLEGTKLTYFSFRNDKLFLYTSSMAIIHFYFCSLLCNVSSPSLVLQ